MAGGVTSGAFSFTFGIGIIMAHVAPGQPDDNLQLEIGRTRYNLERVAGDVLYDPDGSRMRD